MDTKKFKIVAISHKAKLMMASVIDTFAAIATNVVSSVALSG